MVELPVNETMLTAIAGALSFGVRYLSVLTGSVKELNLRMADVIDTIKDHEQRIRIVEKTKHKRGSKLWQTSQNQKKHLKR